MMSDDFMDLLSGASAGSQGQEEKGMGDLLGSLPGGGGGQGADAGDMAGMLGSLLGGGGGQGADAGDMAGMLGSLLGGGGAPQQAAGGAGGLLGSLLGGGGGGMGGLLGGLLGGGGGQNSFAGGGGPSMPFAGTLAEKLGISEQMANMLIMGAIGLLTSSMAKNRSANRSGEIDFDSLTDPDFIRSSGVSSRLADQMGISEDEAIHGLQQTMGLMATGKPASAARPPRQKENGEENSRSDRETGCEEEKFDPSHEDHAQKEAGQKRERNRFYGSTRRSKRVAVPAISEIPGVG